MDAAAAEEKLRAETAALKAEREEKSRSEASAEDGHRLLGRRRTHQTSS